MLNASYTTQRGLELYAFGGASYRDGEAAANWRLPNGNNTVRAIWPDGFLPLIKTDIWDGSAAVGVKGNAANWRWDLSTEYGFNTLTYDVNNTNNASMGTASPKNFDAGRLGFGQWTTNLDLFRELSLGHGRPLRTALGAEFRLDQFQITAGDSASWMDGGQPILDGPNAGSSTIRPAPGAQGFPGFRPADEQNATRNNYALYADLETDLSPKLLFGVALHESRIFVLRQHQLLGHQVDGQLRGPFGQVIIERGRVLDAGAKRHVAAELDLRRTRIRI